jgi:hypothetical protein
MNTIKKMNWSYRLNKADRRLARKGPRRFRFGPEQRLHRVYLPDGVTKAPKPYQPSIISVGIARGLRYLELHGLVEQGAFNNLRIAGRPRKASA